MVNTSNLAKNAETTDGPASGSAGRERLSEANVVRGSRLAGLQSWGRHGWIGVLVIIIGLWWLLTGTRIVETNLFPSPSRLIAAYNEIASAGHLWTDVLATIEELAIASVIFIVTATVVGIYFGAGPRRFDVTYGPIATIFAMPKITFLPVFVLAFGFGVQQKVLFGALYGLFPLIMNTMIGARSVLPAHRQLFDSIGAGSFFRSMRLTIPSMLPYFMTGLRIGYVYAGIGVLLAEMYVSSTGLGQQINSAADQTTLDHFWVYVLFASLILVIGAGVIKVIENRLDTWRK